MGFALLIVAALTLYLIWCLVRGKIYLTTGTDLRRRTVTVDRATKPVTFWLTWSGSLVALVIFTFMLLRHSG